MCGRFLLESDIEYILKQYRILKAEVDNYKKGDYYPSQDVPIVLKKNERTLKLAKWGFDLVNKKTLIINARAETVSTKPMFKNSFYTSRCIVPANLFYEWKDEGNDKKIMHEVYLKNKSLISLGGLFKTSYDKKGNEYISFAIITTEANSKMKEIHSRMPLIINEDSLDYWLNNKTPMNTIKKILKSNIENELIIERKDNAFQQMKLF